MTRDNRLVWALAIAILMGLFLYLSWDGARRESQQRIEPSKSEPSDQSPSNELNS